MVKIEVNGVMVNPKMTTGHVMQTEDGYGAADDRCRVDWPYRELAAWIIKQALEDAVLSRDHSNAHVEGMTSHRALVFLFDVSGKPRRDLWLAWLNMTERDFWSLMATNERFGEKNQLPGWLKEMACKKLTH